jgi:hypothetical protein
MKFTSHLEMCILISKVTRHGRNSSRNVEKKDSNNFSKTFMIVTT